MAKDIVGLAKGDDFGAIAGGFEAVDDDIEGVALEIRNKGGPVCAMKAVGNSQDFADGVDDLLLESDELVRILGRVEDKRHPTARIRPPTQDKAFGKLAVAGLR